MLKLSLSDIFYSFWKIWKIYIIYQIQRGNEIEKAINKRKQREIN